MSEKKSSNTLRWRTDVRNSRTPNASEPTPAVCMRDSNCFRRSSSSSFTDCLGETAAAEAKLRSLLSCSTLGVRAKGPELSAFSGMVMGVEGRGFVFGDLSDSVLAIAPASAWYVASYWVMGEILYRRMLPCSTQARRPSSLALSSWWSKRSLSCRHEPCQHFVFLQSFAWACGTSFSATQGQRIDCQP